MTSRPSLLGATEARPTRVRAGEGRSADVRHDIRPLLARERRSAPAVLVLTVFGALVAGAQAPYAWVWFIALLASGAVRYWLALQYERPPAGSRAPLTPRDPRAVTYVATYGVDLLLWAVLFASVPVPGRLLDQGVGLAAAGVILLAALTLGAWRAAWLGVLLGWSALSLLLMVRTGFTHAMALGLPLWIFAVWWMSHRGNHGIERTRTMTTYARAGTRSRMTATASATRIGWTTALGVLPTPVLMVRHGRIVDVNAAAAQVFGQEELALIGRRVDSCMRIDPPHALDPEHAPHDSSAVHITPLHTSNDPTHVPAMWSARVRVLEPGKAGSSIVVALRSGGAASADASVAAEAQRFALGVGGARARAWYRDESGRLVVPSGFPPPPVDATRDPLAFPLRYCLVPEDQLRADAMWRTARELGSGFDELLTLVDPRGDKRTVRIVCVVRTHEVDTRRAPTTLSVGVAPPTLNAPTYVAWSGTPAIVGAVVPPRAASPPTQQGLLPLLEQLPMFVWLADPAGRIVYVHGGDPWRWGMQQEITERPLWFDAFNLRSGAKVDIQGALQRALSGKPTYDLINGRQTRSGGSIVLRSHFIPYRGDAGLRGTGTEYAGTLVLDTIASPQQLTEIDRLRRTKAQYRALIEASTNFVWSCDAQFRLTFVSKSAAREIYGYEPEELIGRSLGVLLAPGEDQKKAQHALVSLRLGNALRDFEMTQVAKSGTRLVVSVNAMPIKTSDGAFGGAIGMNADLTVLKLRERRLTEALRIERTVLDSAGQAIAVIKDGVVARCNDAFLQLMDVPAASLARTPIADFLATAEEWRAIAAAADAARVEDRATMREVQIRPGSRANGSSAAWCQLTARAIAAREYVVVLADIDHIRQREADALHEAQHDDLTGLPNRRLMSMRAATALAATTLRNARCALLVVDLDGFKEINDHYGHDAGDHVLREIAQRLAQAMRPQDTVARRGGDEFTLLIPDVGSRVDVERIAQRVLHAIALPVTLKPDPRGDQKGIVSASIGMAIAPEHGRDLEQLLQLADLAMYEAKLRGKNRYAFAARGAGTPATIQRSLRASG